MKQKSNLRLKCIVLKSIIAFCNKYSGTTQRRRKGHNCITFYFIWLGNKYTYVILLRCKESKARKFAKMHKCLTIMIPYYWWNACICYKTLLIGYKTRHIIYRNEFTNLYKFCLVKLFASPNWLRGFSIVIISRSILNCIKDIVLLRHTVSNIYAWNYAKMFWLGFSVVQNISTRKLIQNSVL